MAYRWHEKTVYVRETTNGKTKWVKIPGLKVVRTGDYRSNRWDILVDHFDKYEKRMRYGYGNDQAQLIWEKST